MPASHNHDASKKVRPSVAQIEEAISKIRNASENQFVDVNDDILVALLEYYNIPRGPIVGSTRHLYKSLVFKKIRGNQQTATTFATSDNRGWQSNLIKNNPSTPIINQIDEEVEDEEEDEDYQVEEEEDDEDEDEDEDDVDEEDNEELLNELSDDDIKVSDTTQTEMSTTMTAAISRSILTIIVSFFIAIFSFYLYSTTNFMFPSNVHKLIKLMMIIVAFSPIGYIIYKTITYYRRRRDEESQRVNNLVNDALEIIQSPDNPRGLMPILHIRDTLLTPAERKTKKMIQMWNKAVKFVEKHESRVKIEIINIDGEDFRAWKWIGLKNSKVN